jgi:hypothetical protein
MNEKLCMKNYFDNSLLQIFCDFSNPNDMVAFHTSYVQYPPKRAIFREPATTSNLSKTQILLGTFRLEPLTIKDESYQRAFLPNLNTFTMCLREVNPHVTKWMRECVLFVQMSSPTCQLSQINLLYQSIASIVSAWSISPRYQSVIWETSWVNCFWVSTVVLSPADNVLPMMLIKDSVISQCWWE